MLDDLQFFARRNRARVHLLAEGYSPMAVPIARTIVCPVPRTPTDLFIALHELGHVVIGHRPNLLAEEIACWRFAADALGAPIDGELAGVRSLGLRTYTVSCSKRCIAELAADDYADLLEWIVAEPCGDELYKEWSPHELAEVELAAPPWYALRFRAMRAAARTAHSITQPVR